MSNIHVTPDNLSSFNRRLQKSLKETLGVEVPLHQASFIFARALGSTSLHTLQSQLKTTSSFAPPNEATQEQTEEATKEQAFISIASPHPDTEIYLGFAKKPTAKQLGLENGYIDISMQQFYWFDNAAEALVFTQENAKLYFLKVFVPHTELVQSAMAGFFGDTHTWPRLRVEGAQPKELSFIEFQSKPKTLKNKV